MLRTTPLTATHRALGAKMVDFGGFEMPLSYGSQIDEHHAVRTDAGMFDVSHMRIVDVRGAAARDFLRFAFANNVDKLKMPGKALYSCLLRDDGGVLDDLIVYFLAEDFFRVVVNAATADKDIAWLEGLRAKHAPTLSLAPRTELAMIAVQGPSARAKAWDAMAGSEAASAALVPFTGAFGKTAYGEIFIARTGYTGEDGFELMVPADEAVGIWKALARANVRPCGLGARDTLRLEAGMNLYGQDMDESVTPLESGLAWTVDLKAARDFVGKTALTSRVCDRNLVGLVLTEAAGVMRAHQVVRAAAGAGEITSGTFSPTLKRSIAFARLPASVTVGESVRVDVRGRELEARVVKPPFVRNGKALVS